MIIFVIKYLKKNAIYGLYAYDKYVIYVTNVGYVGIRLEEKPPPKKGDSTMKESVE
jgi:hypothetical protein